MSRNTPQQQSVLQQLIANVRSFLQWEMPVGIWKYQGSDAIKLDQAIRIQFGVYLDDAKVGIEVYFKNQRAGYHTSDLSDPASLDPKMVVETIKDILRNDIRILAQKPQTTDN